MKWNLRILKASRWSGDPTIKPIFGRNWLYFVPRIHWNHGLPWRNEVVDIVISWLFYGVVITGWPRSNTEGYTLSNKQ